MINPYVIISALCILIATGAGGFGFGWAVRGDHDDAIALKVKKEHDEKVEAERKRGDGLAVELDEEKRNIKTVTVEVVKEIPKVTTVYKESPNAPIQPIPDPVYTYGFVRLWDSALSTGVLATTGDAADQARGADIVRAPFKQADILENHAVNASKYAECRAQLNKLIDWHEGLTSAGVLKP